MEFKDAIELVICLAQEHAMVCHASEISEELEAIGVVINEFKVKQREMNDGSTSGT